MSDRELLELAAKAAGVNLAWRALTNMPGAAEYPRSVDVHGIKSLWNPLTDDGDAFRLALKLRIQIEYVDEMDSVMCSLPGSMGATSVAAIGDVELRYAIVQAAAQLGATL